MRDFQIGDYVEINERNFPHYHGKRGYVVPHSEVAENRIVTEGYVYVKVHGLGLGGWLANSLRLIDTDAEARAVLGDEYFA